MYQFEGIQEYLRRKYPNGAPPGESSFIQRMLQSDEEIFDNLFVIPPELRDLENDGADVSEMMRHERLQARIQQILSSRASKLEEQEREFVLKQMSQELDQYKSKFNTRIKETQSKLEKEYSTKMQEAHIDYKQNYEEQQDQITNLNEHVDLLTKKNTELTNKINALTITMRIPSKHRIFLEEKGVLEEFVEAKLSGKNELAKWALIRSAKDEIHQIIKFNKKFDEIRRNRKAMNQTRSLSPGDKGS